MKTHLLRDMDRALKDYGLDKRHKRQKKLLKEYTLFPPFDHRPYEHISTKRMELQRHVSGVWAGAGYKERKELTRLIVKEWGKIHGNKTYDGFVDAVQSKTLEMQGVASYSKVFAFVYPKEYAIYDARVSCALNALGLLHKIGEKQYYFQLTPSQKGHAKRLAAMFTPENATTMEWHVLAQDEVYPAYIELLKYCKEGTSYTIQHFEIVLFHMMESWCQRVFDRADTAWRQLFDHSKAVASA